MEYPYKIVEFGSYCDICIHKDKSESEDPCFECLSDPVNEHSKKPIKFKELTTVK